MKFKLLFLAFFTLPAVVVLYALIPGPRAWYESLSIGMLAGQISWVWLTSCGR